MTISEFSKKLKEDSQKKVSELAKKYEGEMKLFGITTDSTITNSNKIQDPFKQCSLLQDGVVYTPTSLSR